MDLITETHSYYRCSLPEEVVEQAFHHPFISFGFLYALHGSLSIGSQDAADAELTGSDCPNRKSATKPVFFQMESIDVESRPIISVVLLPPARRRHEPGLPLLLILNIWTSVDFPRHFGLPEKCSSTLEYSSGRYLTGQHALSDTHPRRTYEGYLQKQR